MAMDLLHAPIYRRHVLGYPLPTPDYLDKLVEHTLRVLAPASATRSSRARRDLAEAPDQPE
ncbi:hypothetical protein ACH347_20880 [Saccharopolyspora sp. 5N102]|uniref:hypothetical protein n=1 Tax=Saccharopolyspora sp. 5N102 TaxID=3375155 RepID=UPI0037AC4CED